ncbi:MAG TPA: hypothetical protein VHE79_13345, partial [Spirochaetia bacterium]
MKKIIPCIVALLLVLGIVPVVAQEAGTDQAPAAGSDQTDTSGQSMSSGDDMFNSDESVQQTTQETQNAAPRDTLLKESAPRLTGTFTSKVSAAWSWNDVWNKTFDFINPDSTTLNQETTGAQFGFVARPDTDISLTAEFRTYYPFTQVITTGTAPNTTTYTVPDVSIWSLYSKFEWNDVIFFSFG